MSKLKEAIKTRLTKQRDLHCLPQKRNPVYSIAMYWQDFQVLDSHSNIVIFKKSLRKWLMSSRFFWHLFESKLTDLFRRKQSLNTWQNTPFFLENLKMVKMTISSNIYTISAHNVVGQFGLKMCQKKRKVMNYKILEGFLWEL